MKQKPIVCLIDEDEEVARGWQHTLQHEAEVRAYSDHLTLLRHAAYDKGLLAAFSCIISARFFKKLNLDIVNSNVPELIRAKCAGPLFINWQGFITREELIKKFDGKLFHKFGVRWQTLRLRIQKFEKKSLQSKPFASEALIKTKIKKTSNTRSIPKPDRCYALLKAMASNAQGIHRERIEFYANHDPDTGMQLLEAIYSKLVTDKNRPETCPSRYINSSPVIAKRILHDTLYT
jgi:hypothetical protein